jgi:hypothetical protein
MRHKNTLFAIIFLLILFPNTISANEYLDLNVFTQTEENKTTKSSITLHKILGWSSLGMMAASIVSGFIIPEEGHCLISEIATGLAVATCINGFYEYGGLINFQNGDWRINTHAILSTLATAGFITTLTLGEGKSHVPPGVISSAAFSIATVVLYF